MKNFFLFLSLHLTTIKLCADSIKNIERLIPREIIIQAVLAEMMDRSTNWAKETGKPILAYLPEKYMSTIYDVGSQKIGAPPEKANSAAVILLTKHLRDEEKAKYITAVVVAPIVEEIYYRGFIQQFVLKELPGTIATQLGAPKFVADFIRDSKLAAGLRVALSSFLFSIGHYNALLACYGGGFPQLLVGAANGIEVEANGGDLTISIIRHMLINYRVSKK